MADTALPPESDIKAFLTRLHDFRATLNETDQKLLDAMYYAAMGKHEEKDDDMHAYWVAAGPRGVAVGGPYGGVAAAPWGAAYGVYRPYY